MINKLVLTFNEDDFKSLKNEPGKIEIEFTSNFYVMEIKQNRYEIKTNKLFSRLERVIADELEDEVNMENEKIVTIHGCYEDDASYLMNKGYANVKHTKDKRSITVLATVIEYSSDEVKVKIEKVVQMLPIVDV